MLYFHYLGRPMAGSLGIEVTPERSGACRYYFDRRYRNNSFCTRSTQYWLLYLLKYRLVYSQYSRVH